SFQLDLEITSIIYDERVVKKLEAIETKYMKSSTRVTLSAWQKRSLRLRIIDGLSRLTAALQ
ncbi:MAG: cardiolipin synthase A, partial [Candidatus Saccharibacteria bacterium]|nr:cardiolipin synthase A [Candidatus Saccharibacteria bacterium]